MKRSKYILYIWAIGGILAFTGCNDFLDRSPQGQFTEDDNPGALAEGKISKMRYENYCLIYEELKDIKRY